MMINVAFAIEIPDPYDEGPETLCICEHCGAAIYVGDTYYDILGDPWCESCVQDAMRLAEEE